MNPCNELTLRRAELDRFWMDLERRRDEARAAIYTHWQDRTERQHRLLEWAALIALQEASVRLSERAAGEDP